MGYKSPIDIIQGQIQFDFENGVYKAIQKVDINVDREELIKALQYDRNQYDKGYSDGSKAAAERLEEVLVNYVPQRLIDEICKELTEDKV